jgi:NagD protein
MDINEVRAKSGFLCDMDGVIYQGNRLIDGVADFVNWLNENEKSYLFLTNASSKSPRELRMKLARLGLDVGEEHFYTSALATAKFLASQDRGCSAYVIGEPGLVGALYDEGIAMNDVDPDYVVVGESRSYNYDSILRAVRLVQKGARLIGTNPDLTGPDESGIIPACRAFVAPIEMTTGKHAYFIGKPNALMMRTGLDLLGEHSKNSVMIGDRMDTDIIAGIETGLSTVLVMTGVSTRATIEEYPYRPSVVLERVADIVG